MRIGVGKKAFVRSQNEPTETASPQPYIRVMDANCRNARGGVPGVPAERVGYGDQVCGGDAEERASPLGRTVHLQSLKHDHMMVYLFDGKQSQQQKVHEELPKPAHEL